MYFKTLRIFVVCFLTAIVFGEAQESSLLKDWKIQGRAHIISQIDSKDFSFDTHPYNTNTIKFKLGVEKTIPDVLKFRIDAQDARIMGVENGFVNDAHNADFLQAYVEFVDLFGLPIDAQIGRFQMQYGTERFIGRSLWHMSERSFDGARLKYKTKNFKIDYFHIAHTNANGYMLKVMPSMYPYPAEPLDGYGFYGFWAEANLNAKNDLHVFGYMEKDARAIDITRNTAGVNYFGKFGDLKTTLEFGYQFGTQEFKIDENTIKEKDIAAYMGSLKFDYSMKPLKLTLGGDVVSGTAPEDAADNMNTFSNYPASKHKFLGLMDYFLVTTAGTGNLGVNDYYLGATWGGMTIGKPFKEGASNLSAMLTAHYFTSNQPNSADESDFGQEVDFVLKYNLLKSAFIQGGFGVFLPGEAMKTLYGSEREDPGLWSFVNIIVQLD